MNLTRPDFPPPDFVAFLAQRSGMSEEAAEQRLASWLGEYYASPRLQSASSVASRGLPIGAEAHG